MKNLIYIASVLLMLSSCGRERIFHEKKEVSAQGWRQLDGAAFTTEITDTTGRYDLVLEVEHERSFSYQNLYLNIITAFPSGEKTEQLLSIEMTDEYGQWIGDCKGSDCTVVVDLIKGIAFKDPGSYGFEVQQHSREEDLLGIKAISLGILAAE